jgi:hypothetical protein
VARLRDLHRNLLENRWGGQKKIALLYRLPMANLVKKVQKKDWSESILKNLTFILIKRGERAL